MIKKYYGDQKVQRNFYLVSRGSFCLRLTFKIKSIFVDLVFTFIDGRRVFGDSKYCILLYRTPHYITESVKRPPYVIWDPRKPAQNPVYNCLVIKLFCRTGYHLAVSNSGRVRGLSATNEPHGNYNEK